MTPSDPSSPDLSGLVPGQTFAGRYRIEGSLGQGGMAKIFRARDLELDEEVAVKILTGGADSSPAMIEQFRQEIKLARRVVHRNVCRLHDIGRIGDLLYVTMEVIEGETLAHLVAEGIFDSVTERISIFRDILIGVRAAHSIGIVHLDLKPLNVMLTTEGRTVVMDFGLAGERGRSGALSDGQILGSPSYMSPERFENRPTDIKADIYALGIVLFELFAGRPPFEGSVQQIIDAHRQQPVPNLAELIPDLPPQVTRAIHGMLAKNPKQRLANVDQVLEILSGIRADRERKAVVLAVPDSDLAALMAFHLEAYGLSVRCAEDGEVAIEEVLREVPDAIVLDVGLEKVEGFRVVEILRLYAHVQNVPIFVLSDHTGASFTTYAKQLRVRRLVQRPLRSRQFAREVAEITAEVAN